MVFAWSGCGNSGDADDSDASDVPSDTRGPAGGRDTDAPRPIEVDVGDSRIPYLVIDTRGGTIVNEPKIPAEMAIYVEKSPVQTQMIGIEYRGSSSYRMSDKKSYGIETWDADCNDVDAAFFGFPEEEDWILSGHVVNADTGTIFDPTLMHNTLAYQLYRDMGRYASRTRFVEVELNGEYLGVYVFMEKLKRDEHRIAIEELTPEDDDLERITGGYILKIDKTAGGDVDNSDKPLSYFDDNWGDDSRYTPENSFRSAYDLDGDLLGYEAFDPQAPSDIHVETYFLYEYPKAEEMTDTQKAYIQRVVDVFETSLLSDDFTGDTRTYTDFIDLDSFVDYLIINELCRNVDAYRLSTFLHKDRDGKLTIGPPWDFNIGFDDMDSGLGRRIPLDDWVMNGNRYFDDGEIWMVPFWWTRLMTDPMFRQALQRRWTALRATVLSTQALIERVDGNAAELQENGAVERNLARWGEGFHIDYDAGIESLKRYLAERAAWMDEEIASL